MEKDKIPSIRFKGFTKNWEKCKLKDLSNIYDGTHQTPDYKDNGIMFLSVENIKDLKSNKYISFEDFKKNFKIYPQKNDILMTRIGDIGTPNVVKDDLPIAYYVSLALIKPFNIQSSFLNVAIQSDYVQNGLRERSLLTAIPMKINKDQIGLVDVIYPKDGIEQSKIGKLFENIDNLITLHQNKHGKLVILKKSLLEKMFPKDGSNMPEIRFKGFTEAWEQRKLLECVNKVIDFRGRTPKKLGMDWSENGILALSALNVKDGYIDKSIDAHFGDNSLYKKWMDGNTLHKNQVLFTTEAPAGKVAQIPDNNRYILSQRVIAFELNNKKYDETFFATLLRTPNIQNTILNISSGGTAKGVSQKTLSEVDVMIPQNIEEQKILGNCFEQVDNLITLHQNKLEKLKNFKKSLLNEMFV